MIEELKTGLENFESGLKDNNHILILQKEWTDKIDRVVQRLSLEGLKDVRTRITVLALGGYGRAEMSPYSDIDLLFLYDGSIDEVKKMVDNVLYPLWDSKFEAGGATRTIKDCAHIFNEDIKAQTAMLDARYVAGDKWLAQKFFLLTDRQLKNWLWKRKFARRKYYEQEERFQKFGGSVYMLEPHIKEGEGGLREFQTACWINRVLYNIVSEVNDPDVEFLFKVRSYLHFLSGKREDRLTFDNQKAIADRLKITPEVLMEEFYRATSNIHKNAKKITKNASPFFKKFFDSWQEEKIKKIIGSEPSWQRLMANRDVLYPALSILHESGDIKKLIPSFENIYFKTQYGAYHVYTVDVHSLFSVKRIVDLEEGIGPKLISSVYKKLKNKDVILFAALMHDIGKRNNKLESHIHLGADIVREEAARLKFPEKDIEKVSFLVESHLIMPRIAFSRDLADPQMIENFAGSVGTLEMLDMLFILSYADIASIGPDVWSAWKEKLLNELYLSVRKLLVGGVNAKHVYKEIENIKKGLSHSESEYTKIWFSAMPPRYFIANTIADIRAHVELFKAFELLGEIENRPAIIVRHVPSDTHSEFQIVTKDAPGIFAKIAGTMAANNVSILDAELNTGRNGVVLDVIRVQNELSKPVSESVAVRIETDLKDVFAGKKDVAELIKKRRSLFKRRGVQVQPRVTIDNDVSVYYTVIDIFANDRVGLLYDLSVALFEEGCSIELAKILTKADLAQDAFYVRSFEGEKIESKEKLEEIKTAILEVL